MIPLQNLFLFYSTDHTVLYLPTSKENRQCNMSICLKILQNICSGLDNILSEDNNKIMLLNIDMHISAEKEIDKNINNFNTKTEYFEQNSNKKKLNKGDIPN